MQNLGQTPSMVYVAQSVCRRKGRFKLNSRRLRRTADSQSA